MAIVIIDGCVEGPSNGILHEAFFFDLTINIIILINIVAGYERKLNGSIFIEFNCNFPIFIDWMIKYF